MFVLQKDPNLLGYRYKSIEFYLLKGVSHDFVAQVVTESVLFCAVMVSV